MKTETLAQAAIRPNLNNVGGQNSNQSVNYGSNHPLINSGGHRRQNSTASSLSSCSSHSESGGPVAILTPCTNSHPFDERCIPVTCGEAHPIKIGRAVVRVQPAINNAIFDCKVLSRNHAVMWFQNGKFLIKDTRSSNGTFINNEKLENSNDDSDAYPLYSGDILQLGVEIIDNTKKVASGCVLCMVTLKNENGEECLRPSENNTAAAVSGSVAAVANNEHTVAFIEKILLDNESFALKYTLVPNGKLFAMSQYMKEARFRENALGAKLQSLEEQLASSQEALESSWQALINEEHLLSRIELLESQLALYAAATKSISWAGGQSTKDGKKSNVASPSRNGCGGKLTNGAPVNVKMDNDTSADSGKNEVTEDCAAKTPAKAMKIWQLNDELIRDEIQEIYEDHAKAELAAKDALRKAEEEVVESTMRLHDVENSLLNVESENTLLRRQCDDYEVELLRQRAMLNETLADLDQMREERAKEAEKLQKLKDEMLQLRNQHFKLDVENDQMRRLLLLAEVEAEKRREAEADESEKRAADRKAELSTANDESAEGKTADRPHKSIIESEIMKAEKLVHGDVEKEHGLSNNSQVVSLTATTHREYEPVKEKNYELDLAEKDDEDNIRSLDNSLVSVGRCACERVLPAVPRVIIEDSYAEGVSKVAIPRLSTSATIQVLLFSALPFMAVFFTLLFPLYYLWVSMSGDIVTSSPSTPGDTPSTSEAVANGTRRGESDL